MKLLIAGSRSFSGLSPYWFRDTLLSLGLDYTNPDVISEIVSGGARGVDTCGEKFAFKYTIPVQQFPVSKEEWDSIGPAAGPLRNKKMAKYSDALLLVWDGKSPGSASMKKEMEKLNKPIYEIILKV